MNALTRFVIESGTEGDYRLLEDEDGFDIMAIEHHETVSLVGAFGPYIRRLKAMGNPFFVIEKNPQALRPDEIKYFKPETEIISALEKSSVLIITGTAIVNNTIDRILLQKGSERSGRH